MVTSLHPPWPTKCCRPNPSYTTRRRDHFGSYCMVPALPSLSLSLSLHIFSFAVVLPSFSRLAFVHTCGCHMLALPVVLSSMLQKSFVQLCGCPRLAFAVVLCSFLHLSFVGFRGCPQPLLVFPRTAFPVPPPAPLPPMWNRLVSNLAWGPCWFPLGFIRLTRRPRGICKLRWADTVVS